MSEFETPSPPPSKSLQVSVLHFWLAIAATFVVGIGLGFILRPPTNVEPVVEVVTVETVVTATPNSQAIAQADTATQSQTDKETLPLPTATLQREPGFIGPPPPPLPDEQAQETIISADEPPQTETNSEAQQADMMDLLLADARHFQGDPEAPITIIEFSDFK